jgi:hypothetical protein
VGFLWIREAGIALLQKSSESSSELGFSKGLSPFFAQPELSAGSLHAIA